MNKKVLFRGQNIILPLLENDNVFEKSCCNLTRNRVCLENKVNNSIDIKLGCKYLERQIVLNVFCAI